VLVIALMIDPDAGLREPLPREPPPRESSATLELPVSPREPWHFDVGASLHGAVGLLPGAGLGGAVRVGIDAPALPAIELRGTAWPRDETRDQNHGGRFSMTGAGLGIRIPIWKVEVVAGGELARMTGTGIGFDRVQTATAWIPALTVEPRLVIASSQRVSFTAGFAVWIPLVRPRFTFEQAGMDVLVYQPALLAGIADVGASLRF